MRIILTVALVLALAQPAAAVTLVNPDGSATQPYQAWADAARVPTPEGVVTVYGSELCPGGVSACSRPSKAQVGLVVANRLVLLHELGHIFDAQMPQWKRDTFLRITGRTSLPWHGMDAVYNDGREFFAESYAACAAGASRRGQRRVEVGHDFAIRRVTLRRACKLIRQPR